jgi:2-polyprenyl-3-methyl-5-hydroxy-6-metoxy-1,4-benzoquinol methylase
MKIKYKKYNCPVCHYKKNKQVYSASLQKNELPVIGYDYDNLDQKKIFNYVKCLKCNHVYASPRIQDIYKYYIDKEDKKYESNSEFRRKTYSNVIQIIKKYKKNGEILEVGSGMGDFIHAALNSNYNCTAIEISKPAFKISKALGHNVYNVNLDDFMKFNKKKFDIIIMMGVIEHLEYPDEEIKKIYNLLNENGLVVLWTGDYDSIYSKILKKNWWYVIGQHIQLFSRKSLINLFNRNSFKLEYNKNLPYVFKYDYLHSHLKRFLIYKFFLGALFFPILKMLKEVKISLSSEILMIYKKNEK